VSWVDLVWIDTLLDRQHECQRLVCVEFSFKIYVQYLVTLFTVDHIIL